ncbi:MAG TPA: ATP-binding protein [Mucilaginibacter sp.]|nr:ATP-binding protein [Mucilaginibacter sp.]
MNQHLQKIQDLIERLDTLSTEEKAVLAKTVKNIDADFSIAEFKLDRTEKIKRTTAVLLEETIEELEHKRKAIEEKNRDLELESALERVRTVAMGMRKADDLLNICKILFEELTALGFGELRNAMINIVNDENGSFLNYDFKADDGGSVTPFLYNSHPVMERQVEMTRSASDAFFEHILTGEDLENFKAFRVQNGEPPDPKLENVSTLYYYFYSIGIGSVGISTFSSLTADKLEVLKRFRNVFDLAYRRYADIELAGAQARESQIQLALERVRARTMAMQRSEELAETAFILFQQFKELGENPDQATIGIINEQEHVIEYWVTMYGSQINKVFKFSIDEPNVTRRIYDGWKARQKSLVIDLTGQELYDFTTYRASMGGAGFNPDEKRRVINVAFFSKGIINVQSTEARSAESIHLLERFAGVFEGTYTRFLDLQKAEAQVRESQIELALERVRARTMAMYHSEELAETASVLFEQLSELGSEPARISIGIMDREKGVVNFWATDQEGDQINIHFTARINEKTTISKMYAGWQAKLKSLSIELKGKELAAWVRFCREEMGIIIRDELLQKRRVHTVGYFSHGWINYTTHAPLSSETTQILERFATMFSYTYTRFLDLQKAEAQVREAKIEAALERTRTQSMLMQHSTELDDTLRVFHQQVLLLGIQSAFSFLWLPDEEKDRHIFWAAWAENNSNNFKSKAIDYPLDRNEPATAQCLVDWKGNQPVVSYHVPPAGVKSYFAAWQELIDGVEQLKPEYFQGGLYYVEAFIKYGCFGVMVENSLTDEEKKILGRLAIEFERAYTRFLDLQKAEAQSREAQIELSLERVRAKTMAMHNSEDVGDTVATMFDELVKLGVEKTVRCGILIIDETKHMEVWTAAYNTEGKVDMLIGRIDMMIHPLISSIHQAWKNKEQVKSYELTGKDLKAYYQAVSDSPEYPVQFDLSSLPAKQTNNAFFFPEGAIFAFTLEPPPEEAIRLFKRFAGVFGLTYRRYLDLQKAEKQARQAQIEVAMEKVRSRSLAMQKPEELVEVAQLLRQEMASLGVEELETSSIYIHYEATGKTECWFAIKNDQAEHKLVADHMDMDLDQTWVGRQMLAFYHSGEKQISIPMQGDNRKEWINYCSTKSKLLDGYYGDNIPDRIYHLNKFSNGYMGAASPGDISAESWDLLQRATAVFSFAYTRFSDLQQAEEQARESQIQLGLERVRAAAMAMHDSNDVGNATALVFSELYKLGITPFRCGICIVDNAAKQMEVWSATSPKEGIMSRGIGKLDMTTHPLWTYLLEAWKQKKPSFVYTLEGQELVDYYKAIKNAPDYEAPEINTSYITPDDTRNSKQYCNCFLFNEGCLFTFTPEPFSTETSEVLEKFAAVFGLTYRRYLDLQKAEEQAREAKIEAALEKVRGKAMAMYNSADLTSTASMVFTELRKLGINPIRCGVGMISNGSRKVALYSATTSADGDSLGLVGWVMLASHPVLDKIYESLLKSEDYFPVLKGKQLKDYYDNLLSGLSLPTLPDFHPGEEQFGHFFPFPDGCLYAWAEKSYNDVEIRTLKRFASVIDLTFRRYVELQKSEASAREAVRAASLDRVRAEIASMRSTNDLERITPLIWNELTILGIPFIRCGVFIIDEQEQLIHTHLSTADGKALATFNLQFDSEGISQDVLPAWRNRQIATIHWSEEEFATYTKNLVDQGTVKSKERYVTEHPDTSLDLHFLPFLQGMLYVGNIAPLTDEDMNLVQSLADAFSTAYARYEDFNKLEAAKQQVENTLTDLKATQTKLIQSEKMASLGELTAGIAHEIQNPLNFVNNFSEVNQEMIEELEDELKAGNIEEALAIAGDIKQNEEKISHHGKRADGIVKGMLQHSRSGGGEKQLTNINALADEFLRLSYHGLRAKDKVFNAEMITHFDSDLPKISVIPQDIGRVMLNLFNNAFYAVNQKKKNCIADYKAEVMVSTSTENGQVMIKVKDNGVGMPDSIKEKIMQPFFTTKPTGEGTGLGLSLTYDMVVKGHGGTIQVNSVEGEGSEFVIQLPVN